MRRRYRYNPLTQALEEISFERASPLSATVWNDLPGYESPATGEWVEGRKARREDLKRSGCRPYEGREQEAKEAQKLKQAEAARLDQLAEKMAYRAWDAAPERVRKQFRSK